MLIKTVNNKLIAKNTLSLYLRMLFTISIQLYTVPVILKALGVKDYGLYSVVSSIMVIASLVGFIASGCQRFFSYSLGKNDLERLKKLFNTTQTIYVILAITFFLLLEVVGFWFINNKMKIPDGRLVAAHWVFLLSSISFAIGLITIPYNALIIAHEKMSIFAYISILSSLLKLLAALTIANLDYDRLIFYAVFMLVIQLLDRLLNHLYCLRHFEECRHWKFEIDIVQSKELLIFSGYNTIGAVALIFRNQGMNVIMNLFFGSILNAAHSIASQIQSVMNQLMSNIYQASRPQITKCYALGDTNGMWRLVFRTSLLSYYMLLVISVIALFEIPTVLSIWLHEVPPYTISICRVFIISLLLETISNQLIGVFQAMNRIKDYQLSSSILLLFNLPIAYFFLKYDASNVMMPYYIQIVISFLYVTSIIFVSCKVSRLDFRYFFYHIFLREAVITSAVILAIYYLSSFMAPSITRVLFTTIYSIFITGGLVLLIGFEKRDLLYIRNIIIKSIIKE